VDEVAKTNPNAGNWKDFDPESVPMQLAATILLVDDRPGPSGGDELHVLMLRRRQGSAFVGGLMVFPGGGIDADDRDPAYAQRATGIDEATAAKRLQLDDGALAYWVAAVRETLEEVGVLLAAPSGGGRLDPRIAAKHRHDVDRGGRTLLSVLDEEDLLIDAHIVYDIGRWITPVGPPRRYDTRFFVARMPEDQEPLVDAVEAVHLEWVRPVDGLAKWRSGEFSMLPPTVAMLQLLDRFRDADDVIAAAARAEGPGDEARLLGPPTADASFRIVFPGDDDYDDPEARPILGWVYRLG
jgi:8-oxo-dGTP pyrophosphatase MutT (NUDIX family)